MEREGFKNIFQLEGGILKYFEECGGAHYDGECFVFDQRVGVDPSLHETARLLIATGDVETRERLNEGLPTAGLALIDFPIDDWRKVHPGGGRLEVFVSPRSL